MRIMSLLFFVCIFHAYADFDGLAGLKFGQIVDISDGNYDLKGGGFKEVSLTNTTFAPFIEWKVRITTTSHRVAQLVSSAELETQQKAVQEKDRLIEYFKSTFNKADCKKKDEMEQVVLGYDSTGGVAKVVVILQDGKSVAVILGDVRENGKAKEEQLMEMKKRMPQPGRPRFNGLFGVNFLDSVPEDAFLEGIKNGDKEYSYKLEKPFYGIKECSLSVTKKRGLVWCIMANGEYPSLTEADKAKSAMVAAIEKKYGIPPDCQKDTVTFSYNPIPEEDMDFTQNVMIHSAKRGDNAIVSVWAMDFRGIGIVRAEARQEKGSNK